MSRANSGPNHSFCIATATLLKSADQAIFLHHIEYWIDYNRRMDKNFHEGRHWMYDKMEDLHGHFPYWSFKQLRLIIDKLVESGILLKGNFNETKYDRTIWYSLDYEKGICISPNGQMEKTETADGNVQKGRPIPHNIPHDKTHTSKEDIAQTTSSPRYEITFSFTSLEFQGIETKDLESWKELYPSTDVLRELKAMTEWILANPSKAKSKKRWRQFINTWLKSTNEKNLNKEAYQAGKKKSPEQEWEQENRDFFFQAKKDNFDALKHMEYRNGFVFNSRNNKDLSVKMNPASFREIFEQIAGVKRRGG